MDRVEYEDGAIVWSRGRLSADRQVVTVPDLDLTWLLDDAAVEDASWREQPGGYLITLNTADQPALQQALDGYSANYLKHAKAQLINRIMEVRNAKALTFRFGRMAIPLTADAQANITGAVAGLTRNSEAPSTSWHLGDGNFVELPRSLVMSLGDAAFAFIQSLFAKHRQLVEAVRATPTLDGLDSLDIESGWPE